MTDGNDTRAAKKIYRKSGRAYNLGQKRTRHGLSETGAYRCWHKMKLRCMDETTDSYERYGGRGIAVCERWLSFANFFEDMGERPLGKTLDRIETNENYEPGNCRWATASEQQRNRRGNFLVDFRGEKLTVAEIKERSGSQRSRNTILYRLGRGWTIDEALSTPGRIMQ